MNFRSFYSIFFYLKKLSLFIQILHGLRLTLLIALPLSQCANAQSPLQSIEQLRSEVAHFLTDGYMQTQAVKVDVQVGRLDNRLRLAKCSQDLEFQMNDVTYSGGSINVQVRCSGISTWTILVPAQAKVYRSVAVASRNLQRGELVSTADLSTEIKAVGDFRLGFALTPDTIIGKEMKVAINKGELFRNSALDSPRVIKRGDTVSMEANAGDISVRTSGTAVSDGRIGQQIRIKNNQSARIINAKVVGVGKVVSIL